MQPTPEARVVDLGAGAGFPSFPLKFALPGLRVTLVESVRKKVSFCQEVIRATGSAGIEAICGRGEDIARQEAHRGGYAWAVSRALASSAEVLKLAHPFLAPGGSVLIYKGAPGREELDDLDALLREDRGSVAASRSRGPPDRGEALAGRRAHRREVNPVSFSR